MPHDGTKDKIEMVSG